MDLSCPAAAQDDQTAALLPGQPFGRERKVGLGIDEALGSQTGQCGGQDAFQPAGTERGIQQDEIGTHGRSAARGLLLGQPAAGIGPVQPDDALRAQLLDAALQAAGDGGVLFDHVHAGGPPGGGFEAQGAAAGKQVDAAPAGEVLPQPVEQGLADPAGCGPQARGVGYGQQAALPLATDDADAGGHGLILERVTDPLLPWV